MKRMFTGLDSQEIIARTRRILSMQRAIAAVVLIAMILSMIPFQVFASTNEPTTNGVEQTEVSQKIKNYDVEKQDIPILEKGHHMITHQLNRFIQF